MPFSALAKRHREIVPLAALGCCLALAAISDFIGLTAAFGAFIAGLAIGSTQSRRQMIRATEPIQGVLAMVFFLSIGLLIDLAYIWENFATVVVLLLLVLLVKSALNLFILRILGEPWPRAFLAGILLSQVGEFSFVLAGAGVAVSAVGIEGHRLIVAIIALSLVVSPLWLMTARRMRQLTAGGIWRLDDLLFAIYEQEARLILRGAKRGARDSSAVFQKFRNHIAELSHRMSEIRARRQVQSAATNDDENMTPLKGEVLPPERHEFKRRA